MSKRGSASAVRLGHRRKGFRATLPKRKQTDWDVDHLIATRLPAFKFLVEEVLRLEMAVMEMEKRADESVGGNLAVLLSQIRVNRYDAHKLRRSAKRLSNRILLSLQARGRRRHLVKRYANEQEEYFSTNARLGDKPLWK